MKTQILLLLTLVAFFKASSQNNNFPVYNPDFDYRSASNRAIESIQNDIDKRSNSNSNPHLLWSQKNVVTVKNHVFLIGSNKDIPSDIKNGIYFYNNQFNKGELSLKDGKSYNSDYIYRLNLVSGDIEIKNKQAEVVIVNVNDINTFSLYAENGTFTLKEIKVKESPYFYNDEFQTGELILTRDRHYKSEFRYRFDQFSGTLEVKYPDNQILTIDNNEILAFSLNIEDKVINFIQVPVANKPNEFKLLQVIYFSPNLKLLRDSRKAIRHGLFAVLASKNPNDKKDTDLSYLYREEYSYYLSYEGKLQEVQLTEKSLSNVLPHKKKELKKLFSQAKYKENLTVSKVFDLLKALDKTKN